MRVNFTVNGRRREADDVWEGESLLYVLRERLGLPGSKNACEQGECGSCTVRLDGVPVCACLVAAGQVEGREVLTVEGLAEYAGRRDQDRNGGQGRVREGELSHVQQAFMDAGAVQCGFCTPGLLVAADEMLERNPSPTDADIREALSGNLCRCTGYEAILDAVRLAAARQEEAI
ncbi:(2Fe-2S)-binding protein [Streptomyces sp. NPDC006638]|uniref:(2Fe-2S)-binding protein n=1 Tax=unclassified Streptomyces TaxID=2593676 RepID=UPI0033A576EB